MVRNSNKPKSSTVIVVATTTITSAVTTAIIATVNEIELCHCQSSVGKLRSEVRLSPPLHPHFARDSE